jgi:predicted RNase H-like HicB family nuclease
MTKKTLEYYRQLPYERTQEVRKEGSGRYFLYRIAEIPAIAGDGATKDEARTHLKEAFDDCVSWRLEDGLSIAMPQRPVTESAAKRCRLETRPAEPPEQPSRPSDNAARDYLTGMEQPAASLVADFQKAAAAC